MSNRDRKTWSIGAEYDDDIRAWLRDALEARGYSITDKTWAVAGSQELAAWEFDGPIGPVTVRAETYTGLAISADTRLVEELEMEFHGRVQQ